jgi:aspartyl-tRNA synthetase|tara:strand:- start:690 stop:1985 length:1296 start_codon:yes stop_codon:yes gene_type:complete
MTNNYIENFSNIDKSHYNNNIRIIGWIEDSRSIGSLIFLTLRNSTGKLQLVIKKNLISSDVWTNIQTIPRQSTIDVIGKLVHNEKNNITELVVENIKIINKSIHPLPLDPTGRVDSGLDINLDYRPLALRKPEIRLLFKIRNQVLNNIRQFFIENNFIEINTPKILSQGAEGGATLFQTKYFDKVGFLAQSPQLYKEQLMIAFERVYEISHYFRAEKSHTTRHLNEFLSVDFEWSNKDNNETMNLCEELIKFIIKELLKNSKDELAALNLNLERFLTTFQKLTYDNVIDEFNKLGHSKEYGEDITEHDLSILGQKFDSFYFITDWPKDIKPFYIASYDDSSLSQSFDLQFGNIELSSGGVRIHNRLQLEKSLLESGLELKNFSSHLQTFDWGMPPHSGLGLGFDRLMMVLCNRKNIREVILYPRDQDRLDP